MMNAPGGQEHAVKKNKFTGDQIAFALKQDELGTRVEEVQRKDESLLKARIKAVNDTRVHSGYRRVKVMLRREDPIDNVKRVVLPVPRRRLVAATEAPKAQITRSLEQSRSFVGVLCC
jgi:hypothetical protein